MRSIAIAMLVLAAFSGRSASADSPAERFASQIGAYRAAAANTQNTLADLMSSAAQGGAFSKADIPLITKYMQDEIDAWNKAADALAKGDETAANAFAQLGHNHYDNANAWGQRLWWRQRQFNFAPNEDLMDQQLNWRPAAGAAPFMEARKVVSDAYGKLAEATVPGADPNLLFKLQDACFNAEVDAEIAEQKAGWTADDKFLTSAPVLPSPELTSAIQRVAEWRKAREDTYRKFRQSQHEVEVLDRQIGALAEARWEAWNHAKDAYDAAQREKK